MTGSLADKYERLTLKQAIAYLGCSRSWFFRHARPQIPVYRLHRDFYIKADLDEFIRSRRVGVSEESSAQGGGRRAPARGAVKSRASWEALASKHGLNTGTSRGTPTCGPKRTARRVGMQRARAADDAGNTDAADENSQEQDA